MFPELNNLLNTTPDRPGQVSYSCLTAGRGRLPEMADEAHMVSWEPHCRAMAAGSCSPEDSDQGHAGISLGLLRPIGSPRIWATAACFFSSLGRIALYAISPG